MDHVNFKEELETCKHIFTDSQMEEWQHKGLFAIKNLDPKFLLEELDPAFDSLKCVAEFDLALVFELVYVRDRNCQKYYAHENKKLVKRSNHMVAQENLINQDKMVNVKP